MPLKKKIKKLKKTDKINFLIKFINNLLKSIYYLLSIILKNIAIRNNDILNNLKNENTFIFLHLNINQHFHHLQFLSRFGLYIFL